MSSSSPVDPPASQTEDLTQLRQIFDRAPVMLYQWVLAPDGEARFTAVSAGCQRIYGLTPAQMLADIRYRMSVVHPDDLPAFQAAVVDSAQNLVPFRRIPKRRTMPIDTLSAPGRAGQPSRGPQGWSSLIRCWARAVTS